MAISARPVNGPVSPRPVSILGLALLATMGVVIAGLLLALIIRFASFPAGYDLFVGANLQAIEPFRTLWNYPVLSASRDSFMAGAQAIVFGLWLAYLFALVLVFGLQRSRHWRSAMVIVAIVAVGLNLLLTAAMPPVFSKDVFHYALYGRMVAYYGENPYVATGSAVPNDLFAPLTAWREVTSRYGPTWTLTSAGLTALAGNDLLGTLVAFKGLAAVANLATAAIVFLLARRLVGGTGLVALMLYAWNPLILTETAGNAHADFLMVALALLGLLVAINGRHFLGYALLLLSVEVKFASAVLIPFFIVYFLVRQPSRQARTQFVTGIALITLAVLALLYVPFMGEGASANVVLFGGSPALNVAPNPIWLALRNWLTDQALMRVWQQVLEAPGTYLVGGLTFLFLMVSGVLVLAAGLKRYEWARILWICGFLIFLYMVIVHGGTFPWYLVAPLAFVIVSLPRTLKSVAWFLFGMLILFAIFAMLFYTVPIPV